MAVFMAAMAAVSVASSLIGASSASSAASKQAALQTKQAEENAWMQSQAAIEKGRIERSNAQMEANNRAFNMSFNEEVMSFNVAATDLNFQVNYMQRLEGYNKVRDSQLTTIGYQGRTVDSLSGVKAAQDDAFEYDNKVDELNREMSQISLSLAHTQNNLNMQRDQESTYSVITASKAAQGYAQQNASLGASQASASAWSQASATSNAAWSNAITSSIGTVASMEIQGGSKVDGGFEGGVTGIVW